MTRVVHRTVRCLYARPLVTATFALAAVFFASRLDALQPITPSTVGSTSGQKGRVVALTDQLRVGLNARLPEDFAFINLVVQRVEAGTLPRSLVDSTYLYARNRYKTHPGSHRLRPIVYFRPVLVMRAKQLGITL